MENKNWLKKWFKKKRNAFTLIELLAIIVILAIIAVITVPIILNIIENAKKGAATNSAHGYKDAISKLYASKLSLDSNYNIPDGLHVKSDFDTMGVLVSGKQPASNSFLSTYKNMVTSGCLQFDEYKVEIVDGKVINAVKGECKTVNLVYTDVNDNGKIDLADTVQIEDDLFYIIDYPENGRVKLLPQYNLNTSSRQENGHNPNVYFGTSDYWSSSLSNYSKDIVNDTYYVYEKASRNNIYSYAESYKNYLIELGAYFVTDARPMTYLEAKKTGCIPYGVSNYTGSCPTWLSNQIYWLGSSNTSGWVYYVVSNGRYLYPSNNTNSYGVRPLIEIYESAITNNYTLTFDSRGGTEVSSKTIVTGAKAGTLPANPTKEGAVFEGWYTDKEYTSEKLTSDTVPVGSTTYYARYVLSKAEYTDIGNDGINAGDTVKILDDEFYVLAAQSNGKVKLLPKYNLNTSSRQESGHNPNVYFGASDYWSSSLSSFPKDDYDAYYVYEKTSRNNIYGYSNNYETYLHRQGAEFVTDVRMMTYEEARNTGCIPYGESNYTGSCPDWVANQTYWLGSSNNNGWVYYVTGVSGNNGRYLYPSNNTNTKGVRPLVEIDESALTNVYTITFDSRGGTTVSSRTVNVGDSVGTLPDAPTKVGATFVGWYADKEYTTQISADTIPIGSTTYYAKYTLSKAVWTDSDGSETITLGDHVQILDDEFYVLAAPSGGTVKILPRYNLNSSSRQESRHNVSITYSSSKYWSNNSYTYRDSNDNDTNNNVKSYVNAYKDYLNEQGAGFIIDAKLMSYGEARDTGCTSSNKSCPAWLSNQTYWLGSSDNSGWIYFVAGVSGNSGGYLYPTIHNQNSRGVRPMIIINESALQ